MGRFDRVTLYVAALTAGAIGAALALLHHPADVITPPATAASLLLLLIAAEIAIIRVHHRQDVMALGLGEAVLAPAIVLLAPDVAILLTVVAQAISGTAHRIGVRKTIFNAAQWSLAVAAGSVTFHALGSGAAITPGTIVALTVAMTVVAVVNGIAFSGVIMLAQRRDLVTIARDLLPSLGLGWAVNTAFGVLFVVTALRSPWAIPLFAVPLGTLYWASRGHAAVIADGQRMHQMHRALEALAEPMDPRDALAQFLAIVRACFDASAADLLIVAGAEHDLHTVSADGYRARRASADEDRSLAASLLRCDGTRTTAMSSSLTRATRLHDRGARVALSAPLVIESTHVGVLLILDPSGHEGFERGDLAVLEALAAQAAGAIRKGELLDTILRERRRFSDIIDNTDDGVLMLDAGGTILLWNPALERITGFTAEEMTGTRLVSALRPRDPNGDVIALESGADPHVTLPGDVAITTRAGVTRLLSCSYARMPATSDGSASVIVVARDVTTVRELERLKDDFIATVSHELRTPLTPILGWAQTLVDAGDRLSDDERRIAASSILRQAEGLDTLIMNLLEVSKIERGVIDLRDAVVDVGAIVRRLADETRRSHPDRRIEIRVDPTSCRARGDAIFIERIVSNLLSNAMKYSPADEPIDIDVGGGGGEVRVAVRDRGPGIAVEDQERIFGRFHRLGDHLTRATGGTGLGLYIARQLARALGGSVTVESAPGAGATFTLALSPAGRLIAVS